MTCNRCQDIHEAQRSGRCFNSCQCDCHLVTTDQTQPLWFYPNLELTGAATSIQLDFTGGNQA